MARTIRLRKFNRKSTYRRSRSSYAGFTMHPDRQDQIIDYEFDHRIKADMSEDEVLRTIFWYRRGQLSNLYELKYWEDGLVVWARRPNSPWYFEQVGDHQSGMFRPGSERTYKFEKLLRAHNRQELQRWMQREEYEPMFDSKPQSALWDWL